MKWKAKILAASEVFDALRVVPRLILIGYAVMMWIVIDWYMALEAPTTQHAALVTAVVGVCAPIAGFYQSTGRKWSKESE